MLPCVLKRIVFARVFVCAVSLSWCRFFISSPVHIFYYNFFGVFSFSQRHVCIVVGCGNLSHRFVYYSVQYSFFFLTLCFILSFVLLYLFSFLGFLFFSSFVFSSSSSFFACVCAIQYDAYFKIFHKIVFRYLDGLSLRAILFILSILQLQFFFCCFSLYVCVSVWFFRFVFFFSGFICHFGVAVVVVVIAIADVFLTSIFAIHLLYVLLSLSLSMLTYAILLKNYKKDKVSKITCAHSQI